MELLIDYADIEIIKNICEYYPVSGVTTNPSILAKTKREPYEVLTEIRNIIGPQAQLHAQVLSQTAQDMTKEAKVMREKIGGNFYVKIPVTREGIKAIKMLAGDGYQVTGTAVYTPLQAYLAAQAGAAYIAPYVNRIDNLGGSGVQTVREIQDILANNGMTAKILAASFKNSFQVLELERFGVAAATLAPDVIEGLLKNASVDAAVADFTADFECAYGRGRTML